MCIEAGGHLPVVQSEDENAFLTKSFPKQNFWVGVTECLCGKKCTADYSNVRYSNWDTCEPKDLDEAKGCALMVKNTGKWQNRACGERQRTICKRGEYSPNYINENQILLKQKLYCEKRTAYQLHTCYQNNMVM